MISPPQQKRDLISTFRFQKPKIRSISSYFDKHISSLCSHPRRHDRFYARYWFERSGHWTRSVFSSRLARTLSMMNFRPRWLTLMQDSRERLTAIINSVLADLEEKTDLFQRLLPSYPSRMKTIVVAGGWLTDYWCTYRNNSKLNELTVFENIKLISDPNFAVEGENIYLDHPVV